MSVFEMRFDDLVGRRLPVVRAPVDAGRLRHFRSAIGSTASTEFIVPPTYLFVLGMIEADRPLAFIEDLGADGMAILHAEQAFCYVAPVLAGDEILLETEISKVFEKKNGALHFVVQDTKATAQDGTHVANLRRTLVIQDPAKRSEAEHKRSETRSAEPAAGRLLVERTFSAITRETLALYSAASGDTNLVHLDSGYARAAGFSDVFAHGMLVMAYLGVVVEEAGPAQGLLSFSVRFRSITQLGAEITCSARLINGSDHAITLSLTAADQYGELKVQGEAVFARAPWGENVGQA